MLPQFAGIGHQMKPHIYCEPRHTKDVTTERLLRPADPTGQRSFYIAFLFYRSHRL
jgi:hypothetical protein